MTQTNPEKTLSLRQWLANCCHTLSQALALQRRSLLRTEPEDLKAANALLTDAQGSLSRIRKGLALVETESANQATMAERHKVEAATECVEGIAKGVESLKLQLETKLGEGVYFSDLAMREAGEIYAQARRQVRDAGDALATENPTLRMHVLNWCDYASGIMNEYTRRHEERLLSDVCDRRAATIYVALYDGFHDVCYHVRHLALAIPEEQADI